MDTLAFNFDFIEDIYKDHKAQKTNKEIQESYGFGSNVVNIYINSFKVISEHYEKSLAAAALDKLELENKLIDLEKELCKFDEEPLLEIQQKDTKQTKQISSLRSNLSSVENELYISNNDLLLLQVEMENVPYWVYNFFSWLKRART